MDDKERKLDRAAAEFATESSWQLGGESDSVYSFFGSDGGNNNSSILLTEFGWDVDLQPDAAEKSGGELGRILLGCGGRGDNLAGSSGVVDNCAAGDDVVDAKVRGSSGSAEPAVQHGGPESSSSLEDRPEKSTASGDGSVSKPSADTPCKDKKKGQKRMRQPRFAFMTKSEVDHLEDGYRWRKYGQKAVKNSPFPRSYYRCTNSKCTVKKRVERSCEDPTVVITTYEGQHCHHTVGFPRGGLLISHHHDNQEALSSYPNHPYINPQEVSFPQETTSSFGNLHNEPNQLGRQNFNVSTNLLPESVSQPPCDEGLLGDIVPGMQNREL